MQEYTKSTFGINRVALKGSVYKLENGSTAKNIHFVNIVLSVTGPKYTEHIPCVAYGEVAERIGEGIKIGDIVVVTARVREIVSKEKSFISLVINYLDKQI